MGSGNKKSSPAIEKRAGELTEAYGFLGSAVQLCVEIGMTKDVCLYVVGRLYDHAGKRLAKRLKREREAREGKR